MRSGKLHTESTIYQGVQIFRRWWVEGSTWTALGVAINGYAVTTDELLTLNPVDPDWWYLCDLEALAAILAPWGSVGCV